MGNNEGVLKGDLVMPNLGGEGALPGSESAPPGGEGALVGEVVRSDEGLARDAGGRFLPGVAKNALITRETAYEYHRLRRERAIEAIEQGIIEGTGAPDLRKALSTLAVAQTRIALDPDNKRAATEAYKALLVSGGFVLSKGDQQTTPAGNTLSLSNDVLLRLVDVLSGELSRRKAGNDA